MATEAETTTDRRAAAARRRTIPLSGTLAVVMAGLVALTTIDVLAVFWFMTAGTTRDLLARTAQLGRDSVQARRGDRFTPVEEQLAYRSRQIASGDNEGTVLFWDATSGGRITSLRELPSSSSGLAYTPDRRRLAVSSSSVLCPRPDQSPYAVTRV